MHGLILAGGEGSRLAADGIQDAKVTVTIAGRPQIRGLVEILDQLGCPTITCMVRDAVRAPAVRALDGFDPAVRILSCHTPSSLHTLAEGLAATPPGPVFCTMVDTVMRASDWGATYGSARALLAEGADAVLAVTPFVDDERPLWVERDAVGYVRRLGSEPVSPPCVTGGVYAFGRAARAEVVDAVEAGVTRMRGFLARLVDAGARVATVEVARIVDVDRRRDLELANAWLGDEAS